VQSMAVHASVCSARSCVPGIAAYVGHHSFLNPRAGNSPAPGHWLSSFTILKTSWKKSERPCVPFAILGQ
ncbi:hypothetical protein, partial [Escherichia coli]|uniref:hypothetical protein n=1 Tax=Escherichia coli TaxID=562 RepID=UPI0022AF9D02